MGFFKFTLNINLDFGKIRATREDKNTNIAHFKQVDDHESQEVKSIENSEYTGHKSVRSCSL